MSILAESLKRLYNSEKISLDDIDRLLAEKRITEEEYNYIVKEEGA